MSTSTFRTGWDLCSSYGTDLRGSPPSLQNEVVERDNQDLDLSVLERAPYPSGTPFEHWWFSQLVGGAIFYVDRYGDDNCKRFCLGDAFLGDIVEVELLHGGWVIEGFAGYVGYQDPKILIRLVRTRTIPLWRRARS